MNVLLDHGAPQGVAWSLRSHSVSSALSKGWDRLHNGAPLKAAEDAGFDVLLTTDRGIRYQQNLKERRIALVVITGTTKWARVKLHVGKIVDAVDASTPGSYIEVEVPFE